GNHPQAFLLVRPHSQQVAALPIRPYFPSHAPNSIHPDETQSAYQTSPHARETTTYPHSFEPLICSLREARIYHTTHPLLLPGQRYFLSRSAQTLRTSLRKPPVVLYSNKT